MKITKQMLESIIREELQKLDEIGIGSPFLAAAAGKRYGSAAGSAMDMILDAPIGRIGLGIAAGLLAIVMSEKFIVPSDYTINYVKNNRQILDLEKAFKDKRDPESLKELVLKIESLVSSQDVNGRGRSKRHSHAFYDLKKKIEQDPLSVIQDESFKRAYTSVAYNYNVDVGSGGEVTISPRKEVDYKTMQPPTFSATGEVRENKITKSLLRKLIIEELQKMA